MSSKIDKEFDHCYDYYNVSLIKKNGYPSSGTIPQYKVIPKFSSLDGRSNRDLRKLSPSSDIVVRSIRIRYQCFIIFTTLM